MVSLELESITPEMAAEWLESNTNNRNMRDTAVLQYARDMLNENWLLTGEAIKFSEDGTLLDGQHRLAAIARSGVTIEMYVARGLKAETQKVMDTNIRRGVGDMLKLEGYTNHMNLAAVARLAMTYEIDVPPTRRKSIAKVSPTHLETHEFVQANPDIVDATTAAVKYGRLIDLPPSVVGVVWWECYKLSPEMCETFFETLANNQTNGIGDPRNTLLQRLNSARRAGEVIPQNGQLSMLFRVWNAWVKGDQMFKLQVTNNRDGGLIAIPAAVKPE